jgi:hypothetical protein
MRELATYPDDIHAYFESRRSASTTLTDGERIPQGGRDATLASIAGSLRARGLTETEIRAALLTINDNRCDPPLDPRDVQRIARSISRYAPGSPDLISITITGTNGHHGPDADPDDIYRLYTDDQINNLPDPTWLVHETIPENSLTVEYGPSGAYKSFDAIALALGIATGTHWNLKHCRQGPVIYVLAEGRSGAKKRIAAWKKHHGITSAPDFHLLPLAIPLTDPAALAKLIRTAQSLQPGPVLIIIDTLARSMPGSDENSTKDISALIAAIDHLREQLSCGIHLIHHTGHDTSRERGNSALRAAADTMIRLTKDSNGTITARCDKQKDADEGPPAYYRFEEVLLTDSGVLVPTDAPEREDGSRKASSAEIAAFVANQPHRRATPSEIRHSLCISPGTLKNRRDDLRWNHRIIYIEDGKNSRYIDAAPAGRANLLPDDLKALEDTE